MRVWFGFRGCMMVGSWCYGVLFVTLLSVFQTVCIRRGVHLVDPGRDSNQCCCDPPPYTVKLFCCNVLSLNSCSVFTHTHAVSVCSLWQLRQHMVVCLYEQVTENRCSADCSTTLKHTRNATQWGECPSEPTEAQWFVAHAKSLFETPYPPSP